jgi:F0F1-type ATP synthase epsilon subunit
MKLISMYFYFPIQAAQDALSEAQRRLGSAKDDKQKAEAQIEIDCAEAAVKAASGAFQ